MTRTQMDNFGGIKTPMAKAIQPMKTYNVSVIYLNGREVTIRPISDRRRNIILASLITLMAPQAVTVLMIAKSVVQIETHRSTPIIKLRSVQSLVSMAFLTSSPKLDGLKRTLSSAFNNSDMKTKIVAYRCVTICFSCDPFFFENTICFPQRSKWSTVTKYSQNCKSPHVWAHGNIKWHVFCQ